MNPENEMAPTPQPITKEEKFKQDPDGFYHVDDLTLAITKDMGGQRNALVNSVSVMEIGGALFMLLRHALKMLDILAIKKAEEKKMIHQVQAQGMKQGFRNFIRGGHK